jgi:hypothetical protein
MHSDYLFGIFKLFLNDRQYSGQKQKGNNLNDTTQKTKIEKHDPQKRTGWIQVLWRGKKSLRHYWDPSYYACFKLGDM